MKRRTFIKKTGILLSSIPFSGFAGAQIKKLPIYLFSKHLHWLNLEEMFKTAAHIGFDGIDLTVRPGGHIEPKDAVAKLPHAVELGKKYNVPVKMITTAITGSEDPFAKDIIQMMGELKIDRYRTGWLPYDKQKPIKDQLDHYTTQLKNLADLNEEFGACGMYQNHSGSKMGSAMWDIWYILQKIESEFLGCQFDIRHAVVENTYAWKNTFRVLKPYIKCIGIKDFIFVERNKKIELKNVPLGEGSVDFAEFFKMTKEYSLSVPLSLHLEYPLGGADKGKNKLTIGPDIVLAAMAKDLKYLRSIIS